MCAFCGGNPAYGQFQCDSDSIRVTYSVDNIRKNGWINHNASTIDTFMSGPALNLEPGSGNFKSIQITALIELSDILQMQGHIPSATCSNINHIFDVDVTANDSLNNPVILASYPISITSMHQVGNNAFNCYLNGITEQNLSIPILLDVSLNYNNYQIKINNLNLGTTDSNWLNSIIRDQLFPFVQTFHIDGTKTYFPWNFQLVGVR